MKRLKEYSNKIIGRQIKKYRLSKGYSIKKLSELTGSLINEISIELKSLSEADLLLFDKIVTIFIPDKKRKLN